MMIRRLLTPRWIVVHLGVLALITLMVFLAFWQLSRLDQKKSFNAVLMAHSTAPVANIEDIVSADVDIESIEWLEAFLLEYSGAVAFVTVGLPDKAVKESSERVHAALQSPPTRSKPAPAELVSAALTLFGYTQADLDPRIPPALIHGGADHLVLALNSRAALSAMHYELAQG